MRLGIRGEIKDKDFEGKKNTQSYGHQKLIEQFLTAIEMSKMDDTLKMILRFKIWGKNPNHFRPLSIIQIAAITKTRIKVVEAIEEEAKYYLLEYLKNHPIVDIKGNFFAPEKEKKNKNKLLNSYGTPLKI